jgi:hypothetical protein
MNKVKEGQCVYVVDARKGMRFLTAATWVAASLAYSNGYNII